MIKHLREKSAAKGETAEAEVEEPEPEEKEADQDDSEAEEKEKEKKKPKKKKRGGVIVPEEWPWEDAKRVFEKPDVKPADEIEVRGRALDIVNAEIHPVAMLTCLVRPYRSSGRTPTSRVSWTSL